MSSKSEFKSLITQCKKYKGQPKTKNLFILIKYNYQNSNWRIYKIRKKSLIKEKKKQRKRYPLKNHKYPIYILRSKMKKGRKRK